MKINKNFLRSFFFLDLPLFLLGLNYMLYNALSVDRFKTVIRIVAIMLVLIGWVLNKSTIYKYEIIACILVTISLIINGVSSINLLVIIIISVWVRYPLKRVIKGAFVVNMLLVLIMIVLMVVGVVDNTGYVSTMGRHRFGLGFENPNVAALFYSSCLYLLVVSRNKVRKLTMVILLFGGAVIYLYTDSRTSFVAMLIFFLIEAMRVFIEKKRLPLWGKIFGAASILVVDLLFILNLVSVFIIDKLMFMDEYLSFRISAFSRMIENSGIRCFLLGGTVETADNFFYMLLFQYGVFIYIVLAIITHYSMKKMVTTCDLKYISLLVALFMVGMMESSLIRPEILVVLIVWKIIFSYAGGVSLNPVEDKYIS